ncbi:hypothetical protein [Bradyrhizobium sp. 2TAF24]|uniref:hypothetical protein n=1 Tax=Bradyrhizobium sp. 2TAF24 TaxID=3233011 RepID=UPI003F91F413
MITCTKICPAIAKHIPRAPALSERERDSLIVVAIFSGLGLLASLGLLLLDRGLHGNWF